MHILLPYPNMRLSAHVLSSRILAVQYVMATDLLRCMTYRKVRPLSFHYLTSLWRPYPPALITYAQCCWEELELRGYSSGNPMPRSPAGMLLNGVAEEYIYKPVFMPEFIGWEKMHASHRCWLLQDDLPWYQQFGWDQPPLRYLHEPGQLPVVGDTVLDPDMGVWIVQSYSPKARAFTCLQDEQTASVTVRQFYTREWSRALVKDV